MSIHSTLAVTLEVKRLFELVKCHQILIKERSVTATEVMMVLLELYDKDSGTNFYDNRVYVKPIRKDKGIKRGKRKKYKKTGKKIEIEEIIEVKPDGVYYE